MMKPSISNSVQMMETEDNTSESAPAKLIKGVCYFSAGSCRRGDAGKSNYCVDAIV